MVWKTSASTLTSVLNHGQNAGWDKETKKIEELTLYIIDQQKLIDDLKKKNEMINQLADEIKSLKKSACRNSNR